MSTKTAIAARDLKGISLESRSSRTAFTGTIASACESIGLDNFIEMARLARANDPRAERFMDAWDALGSSEQQVRGAADLACARLGLVPIELLRVVAEAAYSVSMYVAQMKATLALPTIVERSVEVALTDKGVADRRMLFQHAGFLPTPKGSQTTIAIMQQNAKAAHAESNGALAAPRPEDTIRRMVDLFNKHRQLPAQRLAADLEPAHVTLPDEQADEEGDDV